jgi:1-acyl-sn-glycerol-3-phosphate acyltransferase
MTTSAAKPQPSRVPVRWNWLFNGFCRYVLRYLRKNFNAVRLTKNSAAIPSDGLPVLVVLNHPSWWDPLIGTALIQRFAEVEHFGAIDAVALQQYPLFTRLGFFGVDTTSLRGAAEFLKTAQEIFAKPNRVIWVTAQGHFADARVRPLGLKSGVGHLAARLEAGWILPVALEYGFWNERLPEAFIRIAEPIPVRAHSQLTGKQWTQVIEEALTNSMDELSLEVQRRDAEQFETLIGGSSGVGGLYDGFRRTLSWLRGKRFDARHETSGNPS